MEDKNIEISKEGLEKLLTKFLEELQEERNLVLEKYKNKIITK